MIQAFKNMMEYNCELSIIIPVYHVPDSLLQRSLRSIEIAADIEKEAIVVIDGRTEELSENVKNCVQGLSFPVRILYKDHEGVSAARNYGMKKAKGRWIFFMDADDQLEQEAFSEFHDLTDGTSADLVVMDYRTVHKKVSERHYYRKKKGNIPREIFIKDILKPQSGAGFAWGKLFKREWIEKKGLKFNQELTVVEDAEFMLRTALAGPKIYYTPLCCYSYCYNPNSVVRTYRKDYARIYIAGLQQIRTDLETEGCVEQFQNEYDSCVLYHLLLIAVNSSFHPDNKMSEREKISSFGRLIRKTIFQQSLENIRLSHFSFTRKVTLICIRLHFYHMVQMIALIRHRQLR